MKKFILVAISLAVLPWVLGCVKPAPAEPPEPSDGLALESVEPAADSDLGAPPHPRPRPSPHPQPKPPPHPRTIGPRPTGYFQPHAGNPYFGGMHGPWAKHWLGHHYHGRHYLYGVYLPTWRGYTYRVWNERWLYWSPQDYCWYVYDEALGVFVPLNPDGTVAIDMTPSLPPPE